MDTPRDCGGKNTDTPKHTQHGGGILRHPLWTGLVEYCGNNAMLHRVRLPIASRGNSKQVTLVRS